MKTNSAT